MKKNLLISVMLGLVAATVYFVSMPNRSGLNLLAPLCGAAAVVALFHLVRLFVRGGLDSAAGVVQARLDDAASRRVHEGRPPRCASASDALTAVPTFAGLVAAVVFMLTPAVRAALLQSGPRLFDFVWALLVVTALYLLSRRTRALLFVLLAALLVFFAAAFLLHLNFALFFQRMLADLSSYYTLPGWLFVFFFTTLPFLAVLFSEDGALTERPGFVQLFFHGALSFVTILAVVPPLAPSALMAPYGRLPVAACAFAASVAGYLVAYWWINRPLKTARAVGGVLVLVLAGMSLWNLCTFDPKAAMPVRRVVIKMDAARAQKILAKDPDSPLANYVLGSLALKSDKVAEAEPYLRKAVAAPQPFPFALNDYAEVLRRGKRYDEAERVARRCVACAPALYVGWETLGSILADADKNLDEAESAICKACELSKGKDGQPSDLRMLLSLARVQLKRGDTAAARQTLAEMQPREKELPAPDRAAFEQLQKSAQ